MFDGMSADDTNITASADQQLTRQEDELSQVADDDNTTCKADEPSLQCLAADLLSTWQSLKVFISGICLVSVASLDYWFS